MTWDELREKVEDHLKAEGQDGSIDIDYIDITANANLSQVEVESDGDQLCIY